jgi:hypothetical protein
MYLINSSREVFQPLAYSKRYAEIGVYRGNYSTGILNYQPSAMFLIDPWIEPDIASLLPADTIGDAEASLAEAFQGYYPGGLGKALEKAYAEVLSKFGANPNIQIIRQSSREACTRFTDSSLDYVYIDANHRYDYVLADLERWSPKVSPYGFMVLNDCYVAAAGKKQHLSVLEALSTFIKLSDWRPVALVNQAYTDVLITRQTNIRNIGDMILKIMALTNLSFVEIPPPLLHAAHHKIMEVIDPDGSQNFREYLSFTE